MSTLISGMRCQSQKPFVLEASRLHRIVRDACILLSCLVGNHTVLRL